jgi:hypothetical protein
VDEENQQLKLRALMKHKEFLWDCTQDWSFDIGSAEAGEMGIGQ